MNKILVFLLMLLSFPCFNASADEILLKSGEVIEGNITRINDAKEEVEIDVVINDELIGGVMALKKAEIQKIIHDDRYKHLIKEKMSKSEKEEMEKSRREALKRIDEHYIPEANGLRLAERHRERARANKFEGWDREDSIRRKERKIEKERHEEFIELMTLQHEHNKELVGMGSPIYDSGVMLTNEGNYEETDYSNGVEYKKLELLEKLMDANR